MSLANPIIAVVGAGALGGYYGARLIQHRHQVHLLSPTDCPHIRRHGMRIHSRDGDFTLAASEVNVYDNPRQMPQADLIVITLKTTANARLGDLVGPVVKADSILLTLQNGLGNEELLASLFGEEKIVGGNAFVCINRIGPGEIAHTDHGLIRIGEPRGPATDRIRAIASLFSSSKIPCETIDDLARGKWDKLIWNLPFNGLGAALDMSTDELIGSPDGLSLIQSLAAEVIATAGALNIHFDLSVIEQKVRYTQTMGAYKSSMQIDRQMGRPLEVEAIIAKPLRIAENCGVTVPCMSMLYKMLSAINCHGAIK